MLYVQCPEALSRSIRTEHVFEIPIPITNPTLHHSASDHYQTRPTSSNGLLGSSIDLTDMRTGSSTRAQHHTQTHMREHVHTGSVHTAIHQHTFPPNEHYNTREWSQITNLCKTVKTFYTTSLIMSNNVGAVTETYMVQYFHTPSRFVTD